MDGYTVEMCISKMVKIAEEGLLEEKIEAE